MSVFSTLPGTIMGQYASTSSMLQTGSTFFSNNSARKVKHTNCFLLNRKTRNDINTHFCHYNIVTLKENDTRPNIINNQSPPSLLLIVNHEKKAQRLIKALNPDGYRFDTILNLNYPLLLKPDSQPDLAILWFPYVSFEALPALKNIVNQIKQSGNAITNLPILLIINQDSSHWVETRFQTWCN